jgi:HEAT repeat protein
VSPGERHALFSEPPEHQPGDELDSIGLQQEPRRKDSRRVADRLGVRSTSRKSELPAAAGRHSSRRDEPGGGARSQRERRKLAARKLKKLLPAAVLAGLVLLAVIGLMIPGWITGVLAARMDSASAPERAAAAHALATSGRGLDQMLGRLQTGKPDGSAGAAAVALAKSGAGGLDRLRKAVESARPETRAAAAWGLGLTRNPEAVEPLARLLAGDTEKTVKIQAARALGMIQAPGAVAALVGQAEAEMDVRVAAVDAVLTAACTAARDQLVAGLGASDGDMRSACARALMATEQEELISEADIRKLFASERAEVRAGVLRLLQYRQGGLFAELVPAALADRSELVQEVAADAAALRGQASALEPVEKLAADPAAKPKAAAAAARALAVMGRRSSALILAKAITDGNRMAEVRLAAAESLAALGKRLGFVRLTAPGEFNDEGTHLKLSMRDPDPRWEALGLLCDACDSLGETRLTEAAFEAMRQLSGRKLAPKAELWKPWMEKKRTEAVELGRASFCMEKAAELGKNARTEAAKHQDEAREIIDRLLAGADEDDREFFASLRKTLVDDKPPSSPRKAPGAGAGAGTGAAAGQK